MVDIGSVERFVFGLTVTGLVLAFGHYFAWARDLRRTEAYVYGVAAIFAGIVVWLFPDPILLPLCAFPVVGGLVVLGAYQYDGLRNRAINREADEIRGQGRST